MSGRMEDSSLDGAGSTVDRFSLGIERASSARIAAILNSVNNTPFTPSFTSPIHPEQSFSMSDLGGNIATNLFPANGKDITPLDSAASVTLLTTAVYELHAAKTSLALQLNQARLENRAHLDRENTLRERCVSNSVALALAEQDRILMTAAFKQLSSGILLGEGDLLSTLRGELLSVANAKVLELSRVLSNRDAMDRANRHENREKVDQLRHETVALRQEIRGMSMALAQNKLRATAFASDTLSAATEKDKRLVELSSQVDELINMKKALEERATKWEEISKEKDFLLDQRTEELRLAKEQLEEALMTTTQAQDDLEISREVASNLQRMVNALGDDTDGGGVQMQLLNDLQRVRVATEKQLDQQKNETLRWKKRTQELSELLESLGHNTAEQKVAEEDNNRSADLSLLMGDYQGKSVSSSHHQSSLPVGEISALDADTLLYGSDVDEDSIVPKEQLTSHQQPTMKVFSQDVLSEELSSVLYAVQQASVMAAEELSSKFKEDAEFMNPLLDDPSRISRLRLRFSSLALTHFIEARGLCAGVSIAPLELSAAESLLRSISALIVSPELSTLVGTNTNGDNASVVTANEEKWRTQVLGLQNFVRRLLRRVAENDASIAQSINSQDDEVTVSGVSVGLLVPPTNSSPVEIASPVALASAIAEAREAEAQIAILKVENNALREAVDGLRDEIAARDAAIDATKTVCRAQVALAAEAQLKKFRSRLTEVLKIDEKASKPSLPQPISMSSSAASLTDLIELDPSSTGVLDVALLDAIGEDVVAAVDDLRRARDEAAEVSSEYISADSIALAEAMNSLADAENRARTAEENFQQLSTEMQTLLTNQSIFSAKIAAAESRVAAADALEKEMKLQIQSKEDSLRAMESTLSEMFNELEATKTQMQSKEDSLRAMESTLSEITNELEAAKTQMQSKDDSLRAMESTLSEITNELEAAMEGAEEAHNRWQTANSSCRELGEQLVVVTEALRKAEAHNIELQTHLTSAEKIALDAVAATERAEAEVLRLKEQITEGENLEQRVDTHKLISQLERLGEEILSLKKDLTLAGTQLVEKDRQIFTLQQDLEEAKQVNAEFTPVSQAVTAPSSSGDNPTPIESQCTHDNDHVILSLRTALATAQAQLASEARCREESTALVTRLTSQLTAYGRLTAVCQEELRSLTAQRHDSLQAAEEMSRRLVTAEKQSSALAAVAGDCESLAAQLIADLTAATTAATEARLASARALSESNGKAADLASVAAAMAEDDTLLSGIDSEPNSLSSSGVRQLTLAHRREKLLLLARISRIELEAAERTKQLRAGFEADLASLRTLSRRQARTAKKALAEEAASGAAHLASEQAAHSSTRQKLAEVTERANVLDATLHARENELRQYRRAAEENAGAIATAVAAAEAKAAAETAEAMHILRQRLAAKYHRRFCRLFARHRQEKAEILRVVAAECADLSATQCAALAAVCGLEGNVSTDVFPDDSELQINGSWYQTPDRLSEVNYDSTPNSVNATPPSLRRGLSARPSSLVSALESKIGAVTHQKGLSSRNTSSDPTVPVGQPSSVLADVLAAAIRDSIDKASRTKPLTHPEH